MNISIKATAQQVEQLWFSQEADVAGSFEEFIGRRPVRYFSYGRWAILAALYSVGIKENDPVLLPAFICRDLLSAINTIGALPVYYHMERNLQGVELPTSLIEAKAALVVNYFGFPQKMEPFQRYCRMTGAALIEDNAHGFLSRDENGKALGTRGDIGIFSLRKTVMLPNGAALVMNSPENNYHLKPQIMPRTGIFISYRIKCTLRTLTPFINLRTIRALTIFSRRMRRLKTGYELLPSAPDAEYRLPYQEAPCRELFRAITHLDVAGECARRRQLYTLLDPLVRSAGYEPVFPSLPEHVVPYAYPFYSAENRIGKARKLLARIHLECFPWPELPDAVVSQAPEHYKSVWMIPFLW